MLVETPPVASADPIRVVVSVRATPDHAFDLFTGRMGQWWPLDSYSRAVSELEQDHVTAIALEFQPRLGGSVLEHVSDGRVLPWAEVIEWDPPHAVVMSWRPHSLPEPPTELEATFAEGPGGETTVTIDHRGWERLSAGFRAALRPIYADGWVTTLERFVAAANEPSPL